MGGNTRVGRSTCSTATPGSREQHERHRWVQWRTALPGNVDVTHDLDVLLWKDSVIQRRVPGGILAPGR